MKEEVKEEKKPEKVTIDRIVLYQEPIQERHTIDAFLLFKRKKILTRANYRALVYVKEKLPNRQYFTLSFVPGFFTLNPGDKIELAKLTHFENQHLTKVKKWVETANAQFIITEPYCNCENTDPKIYTFTLKNPPVVSTSNQLKLTE